MIDQLNRILVHARWRARQLLPADTPRRRTVHGADLWMPRAHRLRDYTTAYPLYGRNLLDLAGALEPASDLQFIDVGANIGDSTAQILALRPGRALCVEADAYWLPFLERNLQRDDVTIAFHLLTTRAADAEVATRPVRDHHGTTRFAEGTDPSTAPPAATSSLPTLFPQFDRVRLIKSDTDGYDVGLVPELAEAYRASTPVLFFEYDEELTRRAGESRPETVFERLVYLGYDRFAAWDNYGRLRASFSPTDWAAAVEDGRHDVLRQRYAYWDVAAVHGGDEEGGSALDAVLAGNGSVPA